VRHGNLTFSSFAFFTAIERHASRRNAARARRALGVARWFFRKLLAKATQGEDFETIVEDFEGGWGRSIAM
jgi:hypothetical protein